jgi:MYXO-CTERM domain-containing protein
VKRFSRALVCVVCVAAFYGPQRVADACSAPACWLGSVTPGGIAEVPANLPGIFWQPYSDLQEQHPRPDESTPTLTADTDPSESLSLTVKKEGDAYTIVPEGSLVPGAKYTLTLGKSCYLWSFGSEISDDPETVALHVTEEAPLPTSLGVVQAKRRGVGRIELKGGPSGLCTTTVDAGRVSVVLSLSDEAEPWKDSLRYEMLVDGEVGGYEVPIYGAEGPPPSWLGDRSDLLLTLCDDSAPINSHRSLSEPGDHAVRFRASLPGTDIVLETPEISVTLDCQAETPDTDSTDPDTDSTDSGCAVTALSESPSPSGIILLVLAGLAVQRRRRRTARSA